MKYTQIPSDTFQNIQLNAGVLLKTFTPATATFDNDDIVGATSGGVKFSAIPTFKDFGEGIDNCPKNTKELKKIESWTVTLTGTFATVNTDSAKALIAACELDTTNHKLTPRADLKADDFSDLWWVGDYSDNNDGATAGFVAIHLLNALSTGGFSVQSVDKDKGTFTFEYTAHYSMSAQTVVPFEVYIKEGTA